MLKLKIKIVETKKPKAQRVKEANVIGTIVFIDNVHKCKIDDNIYDIDTMSISTKHLKAVYSRQSDGKYIKYIRHDYKHLEHNPLYLPFKEGDTVKGNIIYYNKGLGFEYKSKNVSND